jgi:hypothetical protein
LQEKGSAVETKWFASIVWVVVVQQWPRWQAWTRPAA